MHSAVCWLQVENEDLIFTLETLVERFDEEMAPFAVGLTQHLAAAFWRMQVTLPHHGHLLTGKLLCTIQAVLQRQPGCGRCLGTGTADLYLLQICSLHAARSLGSSVTAHGCSLVSNACLGIQGSDEAEDDEDIGALAAFGCLRALSTVLESVSRLPQMFPQLEEILFPIMQAMCSEDGQDVFEEILEMISYFTYFSPEVNDQRPLQLASIGLFAIFMHIMQTSANLCTAAGLPNPLASLPLQLLLPFAASSMCIHASPSCSIHTQALLHRACTARSPYDSVLQYLKAAFAGT